MFSNTCVSIDIGKKNIKLVNGRVAGPKIEIYNFDVFKTPDNSIQDGKIIDLAAIINSIRISLKNNKINSKNLKLLISGTSILTRDISIPKVQENEIEGILEFEAQQYFPVSLENYVLDYKIMEELKSAEGEFYRLLLVASPLTQVNEYMQIPKLLKMDINSIDISANCIFKYMVHSQKLNNNDLAMNEYAVIDFGSNTTGICIFSKGTLMFNRVLLKGSKEIDETISMNMNIDYDMSENLKCNKLILLTNEEDEIEQDLKQLNDVVSPAIISLADDINRFLDFYKSRNYGNRVSKIFISGGGSKIKGLDKFLSNYINVPVERINVDDRIVNKNKRNYTLLIDNFPFLLNSIGAII